MRHEPRTSWPSQGHFDYFAPRALGLSFAIDRKTSYSRWPRRSGTRVSHADTPRSHIVSTAVPRMFILAVYAMPTFQRNFFNFFEDNARGDELPAY